MSFNSALAELLWAFDAKFSGNAVEYVVNQTFANGCRTAADLLGGL